MLMNYLTDGTLRALTADEIANLSA